MELMSRDDLENESEFYVYCYKMNGKWVVVLSQDIKKEEIVEKCNEIIDAVVDFKRDVG